MPKLSTIKDSQKKYVYVGLTAQNIMRKKMSSLSFKDQLFLALTSICFEIGDGNLYSDVLLSEIEGLPKIDILAQQLVESGRITNHRNFYVLGSIDDNYNVSFNTEKENTTPTVSSVTDPLNVEDIKSLCEKYSSFHKSAPKNRASEFSLRYERRNQIIEECVGGGSKLTQNKLAEIFNISYFLTYWEDFREFQKKDLFTFGSTLKGFSDAAKAGIVIEMVMNIDNYAKRKFPTPSALSFLKDDIYQSIRGFKKPTITESRKYDKESEF